MPTIGYGRNLRDVGISREEADLLLDHDLAGALADCQRAFAWFDALDDIRQRVIVELRFNLGLSRLLGFGHMLAAVAAGDFARAADEMLRSRWAHQVGARAGRLALDMRLGVESA